MIIKGEKLKYHGGYYSLSLKSFDIISIDISEHGTCKEFTCTQEVGRAHSDNTEKFVMRAHKQAQDMIDKLNSIGELINLPHTAIFEKLKALDGVPEEEEFDGGIFYMNIGSALGATTSFKIAGAGAFFPHGVRRIR